MIKPPPPPPPSGNIINNNTPWSKVLPEKLTGFQVFTKFPAFYGTKRLLPHSQMPANYP